MKETFQVISPIDNSLYAERHYASSSQIETTLQQAVRAQSAWKQLPLTKRAEYCRRFLQAFVQRQDQIAEQIAWQMGRPKQQAYGEVRGVVERANYMIDIAEQALSDIVLPEKPGFNRFIRRMPKGVILIIAPWNYPYLTAINSLIPALMAGNTIILKHSSQTPLCAEQLAAAFTTADMPAGVFQFLHLTHDDTLRLIQHPVIQFVAFTGSVEGGHAVQQAVSQRFIGVGLELGGKDPAYVRADAKIGFAAEELASGVFYNSGQSCCGIERIYCHEEVFDDFVAALLRETKKLVLGNPLHEQTTLGPMVRTSAAEKVRQQINAALQQGAKALLSDKEFPAAQEASPYVAPQILVNVNHTMSLMRDENFGPVVGVMSVRDDAEAVERMNDSQYGLTALVCTQDESAALTLGQQVQTGTWFMNRCDYLDPALAWTGVKDSGYGCTLSELGYGQVTQPKSFHLKRS